jgi:hypothetical protein
VALVRVLLFAALAVIAGALVLYAVKRDRRYLRFIVEVGKYSIIVLLVILLAFAIQRLFGISFGDLVFSVREPGVSSARGIL